MQGLGLAPVLCEHLEALNFSAPTRIQQATLPVLLVSLLYYLLCLLSLSFMGACLLGSKALLGVSGCQPVFVCLTCKEQKLEGMLCMHFAAAFI